MIIPSRNRALELRRCLEALALQNHLSFELIVVDDCSTDSTPAVLRDVGASHRDFRLRSLRNDQHAGANPSRNRGVVEAGGDLIALTDDDWRRAAWTSPSRDGEMKRGCF